MDSIIIENNAKTKVIDPDTNKKIRAFPFAPFLLIWIVKIIAKRLPNKGIK